MIVEIQHGERIAQRAITQAELSFEVRGPDDVRRDGSGPAAVEAGMRAPAAAVSRDESLPIQERANRARGGPGILRNVLHEPVPQLDRSVQGMLLAERDDLPRDGGLHAMRSREGRMRPIEQGGFAALPKARQPLMAGPFADRKGRADLREGLPTIQAGTDEFQTFGHGGALLPRHGHLLEVARR